MLQGKLLMRYVNGVNKQVLPSDRIRLDERGYLQHIL